MVTLSIWQVSQLNNKKRGGGDPDFLRQAKFSAAASVPTTRLRVSPWYRRAVGGTQTVIKLNDPLCVA